VPNPQTERIVAEWRALSHVLEQSLDGDDEELIRRRIEQLRAAYREATGGWRELGDDAIAQRAAPASAVALSRAEALGTGGPDDLPVRGWQPIPLVATHGRAARRRPYVPPAIPLLFAAVVQAVVVGGAVLTSSGGGDSGRSEPRTATNPVAPSGGGDLAVVPPPVPTERPTLSPPSTATPTVAPTPSPTPTEGPSIAPTPDPTREPAPKPTAEPIPKPTAKPPQPTPEATPRPTPPATPEPTAAPATQALDPAETVARFYELVVDGRFDEAAELWTPRMREEYPPDENIDGRFSRTTRIDLERLDVRSIDDGTAVVVVALIEYRSSRPPREFVGTWDLVRHGSGWLMDEPHF
jgi:hypothetical protein